MRRKQLLSLLTPLVLALPLHAAEDAGVPGAFLRFGASARSLGLGNAVTGIADDAASAYLNPAGYARLRTMELSTMGAMLFEDTNVSFFALGLPTENWGSFAISASFMNSGSFERATLYEDLDESFSERNGMFGLSYARSHGRWSWGTTLKTVTQSVADATGGSFGADFGLYLRPHRSFGMGAAVQNILAPEIQLDQEPERFARSYRFGTALYFFRNRFVVLTDLVKTELMDVDLRSGVELWANRSFGLRSGYDSVHNQGTAGLAFRLENWQFDYAYLNHELGATNVLSATWRFGVPYGVKLSRDRELFSPSGSDRDVNFAIATAVRGRVESWQLAIHDAKGQLVKRLSGNGTPPDAVTWAGDDEQGRLVADGSYAVRVTILDDLGEVWDYDSSVQILGFKERTRAPIRVQIKGAAEDDQRDEGGQQ